LNYLRERKAVAVHQSNVNFRKLIQDLADMYSYPVPEVIVTELVANSLDAKADRIGISYDPKQRLLVVEDNGSGMTKPQFDDYHDFAAELKSRGSSIGFAGLGAKISFNVAMRVCTETRSSGFTGGSNWFLKSKKELVWEDLSGMRNLRGTGTRVEVWFNEEKENPYADIDEIRSILLRQYLPLFDTKFLEFYAAIGCYSEGLIFSINGVNLGHFSMEKAFELESHSRFFLEAKKKRFGYGCFGIAQDEYPLGEETAGIGICVYGKVVKHDFFNQFPGEISPRIIGMIEIPPFIKFMNTSKSDFIRRKATASEFRKYYEPARQEFKRWLSDIGVKPIETVNTEDAIKLEQEIKKLVSEIPELYQLFGSAAKKSAKVTDPAGDMTGAMAEGMEPTFPNGEGKRNGDGALPDTGDEPGQAFEEQQGGAERASPISRKRKAGVRIGFANDPERNELAWLDGNLVLINMGHPSYIKVKTNRHARKLHNVFSIAICLERELKEQGLLETEGPFVDKMMTAWGNLK